jgi:hypothetical protein
MRSFLGERRAELHSGRFAIDVSTSTYDVRAHEATLDQMANLLEELATEAADS